MFDIEGTEGYRIINIYRSFNPLDGSTAREKFNAQLVIIKAAYCLNSIVVGDFNLDKKIWSLMLNAVTGIYMSVRRAPLMILI
jgi:hypothetical protein